GDHPRPRGRGDPRRPPLRDAADGTARPARHGARLLRLLQHAGRGAAAGERGATGGGGLPLMQLTDLYREVILDHNKHPRNLGRLEPHDGEAKGHNPLCGDRLTLTLRREGDRLADLRFEGNGCAISMASASMMTEAVKGRTRAEIDTLF